MKFHIITYGCQMNRSDSERIAAVLADKGYQHSPTAGGADLVVINVCSVRQKPVDKAFNKIRSLDSKKIIATGCILENDRKKLEKMGVEIKPLKHFQLSEVSPQILPKTGLVPIMRGCNNFCTYCVVPYTRGREVCRFPKEIICEVKHLIKKGVKEITLLGQNVNSYKYKLKTQMLNVKTATKNLKPSKTIDFADLLKTINNLQGDFKVRFLTNHPKDMSNKLIKTITECNKVIKHIHLPFQAGSNKILKKMNRHYTKQQYLKLVNKIKKAMPNVELSADVIVGFPGETKKDFAETIDVMRKVKFVNVFIAKYSPRAGAAAFNLKDTVPLTEKKRREQTLLSLLKLKNTRVRPVLIKTGLTRDTRDISQNNPKQKLVVILGPTASGKTTLSIKLAKKFRGEVVSADSRQIYSEMAIGTASPFQSQNSKPKTTLKPLFFRTIPHYLFHIIPPSKKFSVAEYQKLAIKAINHIHQKGRVPFLVGGSPFYIYSVVEGWQFPKMKKNLILRRKLEKKSAEELFKMLKKIDHQRAKTIEPKNKRRLIRAIEIAKTLGKVPQLKKSPLFNCLLIGIKTPKKELEKRIAQRTEKMLKQGLEKEVKKLVKKYGFNSVLKESIGYADWLPYWKNWKERSSFHGRSFAPSMHCAIAKQIKQNTLRLAKHQMTWFKRNKQIHWVKNYQQAERLIRELIKK